MLIGEVFSGQHKPNCFGVADTRSPLDSYKEDYMTKTFSLTEATKMAQPKTDICFLSEKNCWEQGAVVGDAYVIKIHWDDGFRKQCLETQNCPQCNDGDISKPQFSINFASLEGVKFSAKILELSRTAFLLLANEIKQHGIDSIFKISRTGSKQTTRFEVKFVAKLSQEQKDEIANLKFPDFDEAYNRFNARLEGGAL